MRRATILVSATILVLAVSVGLDREQASDSPDGAQQVKAGCDPVGAASLQNRPFVFVGTVQKAVRGQWHGGATFPYPIELEVKLEEALAGHVPEEMTLHTWEPLWTEDRHLEWAGTRILAAPTRFWTISECRFGQMYTRKEADRWRQMLSRQ